MNPLTDSQQAALARGLAAFDQSARRRRVRRQAVRFGSVAAVLSVCAVLAHRASVPVSDGLPASVELVRDDAQLSAELEFANACERFNRTDGRLVVLECMLP